MIRSKDLKITPENAALYRCMLSCGIVKSACEGGGDIPKGVARQDWIAYNMACAIEELARHAMMNQGSNP